MTHYPDPRINQALGIEGSADMDDTLAAIAQLRASVVEASARDHLFERMAECLYAIATEGPPTPPWPSVAWSRERIEALCEEARCRVVNLESDSAAKVVQSDTFRRIGNAMHELLRLETRCDTPAEVEAVFEHLVKFVTTAHEVAECPTDSDTDPLTDIIRRIRRLKTERDEEARQTIHELRQTADTLRHDRDELRASVKAADETTEALRAERNEYMRALDTARADRDEARKTATANRERCDELRAELKAATEERDDARTERARLDHNYRLLQQHVSSLEASLEKTERARDAAYAVLHHLTGEFAP